MKVRLLTPAETRIVVDALRRAAASVRSTAVAAAAESEKRPFVVLPGYADSLKELAQKQDRLASELNETTNIKLEKL